MTPHPVLSADRWNEPRDLVEWVEEHPDLMQIEVGEGCAFTYAFIYDGETVTVSEVTVGKCFGCGVWTWVESGETACCGATWEDQSVKLIEQYVAGRLNCEPRIDRQAIRYNVELNGFDLLVDALDDPEQHRALADHYERHFRPELPDQEAGR